MANLMRLLPGLIGAAAALLALKLATLLGFTSLTAEIVVFVVAYIVVTLVTDKAMQRYGS